MTIDYLAPETAIAQRLRAKLDASIDVLVAADLEGVEESTAPAPAVHVLFVGDGSVESAAAGRISKITQQWIIWVHVHNVRTMRTGEDARMDAGPIIEQDVVHVNQKDGVKDLIRKGQDLEKVVLSRAIWNYLNYKILVYQNRTFIF